MYKNTCYNYLKTSNYKKHQFVVGGFFVPDFENYLKLEYQDIEQYLRFGRLPVHELLKIKCATYGEVLGYQVKVEYRVDRNKRIDVVWIYDNKVVVAIEIDEGLNRRALWKINQTKAEYKVCIFFDVKKVSRRSIENFDFKNYLTIELCPRGKQGRDNKKRTL